MEAEVRGEKVVAVAFSGGLDSSLLVACAKRSCEVVACSGYAESSADSEGASRAAEQLGVEWSGVKIDRRRAADVVGGISLPFEPTLMDRSLWLLYREVARLAREKGARVMLLGQLADELFGGYEKYRRALESDGESAAQEMMDRDQAEFASRGRVRDRAACAPLVEARFPFEAREMREFSRTLPVSFKIQGEVRKAVLRSAAVRLGVPRALASRPKKAAQYSSGVQKLLSGSRF